MVCASPIVPSCDLCVHRHWLASHTTGVIENDNETTVRCNHAVTIFFKTSSPKKFASLRTCCNVSTLLFFYCNQVCKTPISPHPSMRVWVLADVRFTSFRIHVAFCFCGQWCGTSWNHSFICKSFIRQISLQSHAILYMFEAHSLRTDLSKFIERWHTQPAQLCCTSCDSTLHVRCFAMVSHRTSLLTIEEPRTLTAWCFGVQGCSHAKPHL